MKRRADPHRTRTRRRLAAMVLLLCAAALLTEARPLASQDTRHGAAAPYLEPDHWSLDALRRLEALGLLGAAYDRAGWGVDRGEALDLMERALERTRGDGALGAMVRDYIDRLRTEFSGPAAGGAWLQRGAVEGALSYRYADGDVLAAVAWPDISHPDEVLPTPLPREGTPAAFLDVSGYGGTSWAARAEVGLSADGVELGEAYVAWDPGLPSLWVGRRHLRLGPGDGGVILSGLRPLDGVGLDVEAFRLPWLLRHLGPARFHTAIARLGDVRPYDNPLLWTMRGSIQPHPRVTLGVNRGVMVPGPEQMTAEWLVQFPLVLIGKHPDGELNRQDNQIASVDLAYNVPLPSLPARLYVEWGFEDSAGAWRSVPGIVAGAYLPRLPGAPALSAGLEHASFSPSCCGNPWWYRHRGFMGGWTDERRPLGHPLGGHGTESSLRLDGTLWDARLLAGALLYHRHRGFENLYAPTRQGTSNGGALRASLWLDSRFELRAQVEHERGEDWRQTGISLLGGVLF